MNLFVPASTTVSHSPQVTVHVGCLSSPHSHNRRLLCHHCHSTHTWKQQEDMESRGTHRLMNQHELKAAVSQPPYMLEQ